MTTEQQQYDRLKKHIEASPNQEVTIWIVSIEDIYETAFGDGKYVYEEKMFFSYKVASTWARWIAARTEESEPFTGYSATITCRVLRLNVGGIITEVTPHPYGKDHETPFIQYSLLEDNPYGWNAILDWCCRKGKTRPELNHKWD